MAAIVFKSGSPPWRQGGRTTETFRSGLIKVTDTYLTPTSTVQADLGGFAVGDAISGVTQAIDGVKIYPEPQIKDNGDGFSTISVTGYGRSTTGFIVEPRLVEGTGYELTVDSDGNLTSEETIFVTMTAFVCRYTVMDGEDLLANGTKSLIDKFRMYDRDGNEMPLGQAGKSVTVATRLAFSDSTYYGSFTEASLVVSFTPTWTIQE